MSSQRPAYLVNGIRTPIGRHRGALSPVRADDLAAHLIRSMPKGLLARLDHVVLGATNQAGEDNRNIARMALLLAGLPYEVPGVTVNRLCGSGLEAVSDAVRRVATGDADCVIAGGVESMSRAPFVFGRSDEPFQRAAPKVFDTALGWRFENPRMAERFPLHLDGRDRGERRREVEDRARRAGRLRPRVASIRRSSRRRPAPLDAEIVPSLDPRVKKGDDRRS